MKSSPLRRPILDIPPQRPELSPRSYRRETVGAHAGEGGTVAPGHLIADGRIQSDTKPLGPSLVKCAGHESSRPGDNPDLGRDRGRLGRTKGGRPCSCWRLFTMAAGASRATLADWARARLALLPGFSNILLIPN